MEEEIWGMVHGLCSVGLYLNDQMAPHGDLSLKQICLCSKGNVKVYDNWLLTGQTNYQKALKGERNVFLAEEQMNEFKAKSYKVVFNQEKADVYSVGMSILGMIYLMNPTLGVYNY